MTLDVHELAKLPYGESSKRIAQWECDNMPEFGVYKVIRALDLADAKRKAEVILDEEYNEEWNIASVTEIKK